MAKRSAGSVAVITVKKRLRLRFTYQGERITHALQLEDNQVNRAIAEKQACEIEIQLALGTFLMIRAGGLVNNFCSAGDEGDDAGHDGKK